MHETRLDRSGRRGLIWALLSESLANTTPAGESARVLDCGGGSGSFAVPLAQTGARVTVVDVSADALATLRRRADDLGVAHRVTAVQGELETLTDAVGSGDFDLVLAHGVLGAVDDLAQAFAGVAERVRPGGRLSVLVGNPVAAVLARAMGGEVDIALDELNRLAAGAGTVGPGTVHRLCAGAGMDVIAVHGIGVFADLVPGRALDAPGARDALERLETAAASRSPFRDIAARMHLLAERAAV